jgi:hypothetical protein
MNDITADATMLMNQAGPTAAVYLRSAVDSIDREFGEGYARENPELVAAMVAAATADFSVALIVQTLQELVPR